MKRMYYFNYIEERLSFLATRIHSRGKLNILDAHIHSESFYQYFLNKLYGWNLRNLNQVTQNIEAIDLIDDSKKIIVQVSATNTKAKIESALEKPVISKHKDYTFKFVSLVHSAENLKTKNYTNPHGIKFDPKVDIIDIASLLSLIKSKSVPDNHDIFIFIKQELGSETDIVKMDSNLATIINILCAEDWSQSDVANGVSKKEFEIERKITFNKLSAASLVIDDYKIHHTRLDSKYAEFDIQGKNKSGSVLAAIRSEYIKLQASLTDDALFFGVIEKVHQRIVESANYTEISIEELELCIYILVVDAFIRCKIFKNPEDYKHALAR